MMAALAAPAAKPTLTLTRVLAWLVMCGLASPAQDLAMEVGELTYQTGDTVLLPCDITNNNPGDRVTLLLWYKEDIKGGKGSPIYRIDARTNQNLVMGQSRVPISDWVNEKLLGQNRVSFDTQLSPASLKIRNVTEGDQGLYRCRVDFTTSQTRTSRMHLRIIVRPGKPQILDDTGTVRDMFAGPYLEGSTVHLACKVVGGKPAPRVVWYKNFQLLSEKYVQHHEPINNQLITYNNLTLTALPRGDLHSNITCEVTNFNNSSQMKTITLDMNFLPLRIEVEGKNSLLMSGTQQIFVCSAFGSRPPATLTWWLGDHRVNGGKVYSPASSDGTTSTSTLTYTPNEDDTNKTLACKAENKEIRQGVLKDSWVLNVRYPPKVTLELTSMLEERAVVEGNDVFFVCKVKSNPVINRMVEWYHNEKPLKQAVSKGIIMNSDGTNLVIQKVGKDSNGNYTCRATNGIPQIGHVVESKPFHLDVKYLPVCLPEGVKVYGVAKEEKVRINCQVAANPANLTFRWTFNNSAEIKHVSATKYTVNHTESVFSYKPVNELDYGTLMCWSRNRIGEQVRPCVFHIIAAGKPDPVKNCSTYNVTTASFHIACVAGFNGGLPQNFTIEVIENDTEEVVVYTAQATDPVFSVTNLKDSTDYRVYITPFNMKGKGQPQIQNTVVRTNTEPKPLIEMQPNGTEDEEDYINPLMVMVFGAAAGLILILIIVTLAVRVRCSRHPTISRDTSKVVVTTITDLEFNDNLSNDRLPLSSGKSCNTISPDSEDFVDVHSGHGSPGTDCLLDSNYGLGGSSLHDPQFLPYQQMSMDHPARSVPDYCTLRRHTTTNTNAGNNNANAANINANVQGRSVQFADPPNLERKISPDLSGASNAGRSAVEATEDMILKYREKQRAGFMYGTLRHVRSSQSGLDCEGEVVAGLDPKDMGLLGIDLGYHSKPGSDLGYHAKPADKQCHYADRGSVVPPPPMFEEGKQPCAKTPLIQGKLQGKPPLIQGKSAPIQGKNGKKPDKMESRV